MLANWGWVFLGNLIGSVVYGGLLAIALTNFGTTAPAGVAAKIIAIAEAKTIGYEALGFAGLVTVFVKAILCNWMVCLAIVAAMTTSSTIGKIACAYMPIFIFFAQGFEHSVVNMFVIPTGMMMGAKITIGAMVAVESNSGHARQSGRRLHLHRPRALHHPQAARCRAGAAHGADASAGRMSEADLKPAAAEQTGDFSPEQKRYLEGFVAGVQIAKAAKSVAGARGGGACGRCRRPSRAARTPPGSQAQNRVLAAGKKLSDPEKFKREQHPFDTYERLKEHAANGEYPKPPDNFRWRFFGLFYVAPKQNSYMCRLRIPNGIRQGGAIRRPCRSRRTLWRRLRPCDDARQSADPRDRGAQRRRHDRGDPGSRPVLARLRRRQYPQRHRHADRRHRSAGADRHAALRARMAFPHPQRPLALRPAAQVQRRLRRRRHDRRAGGHQRHRLPGGRGERRLRPRARRLVPALPRRHHRPSRFRPRHRRAGRAEGRLQVADAVVRVFIDHGDRTDRTKARLKYVLDAMGVEKFLALLEEKLGRKLDRAVPGAVAPRPAFDRTAHIGIHAQKQDGLNWIGVVVPVGRLTVAQMRGLAEDRARTRRRRSPAHRLAEPADLRRADRKAVGRASSASKRSASPSTTNAIRAGLVACTGNTGCKFAASDTKRHAEEIARWCETRVALDTPVNIHLTGCHHSCAQHYVSRHRPARLQGARSNDDDDPVEGYHILVGGGFGPNAALGRELYRDVKAEDAPRTIERISEGLSRAPRLARGNVPRFRAPARDRRAQSHVRAGGRRMSMTPRPPIPSLIPESAPFTPEQRTWLNGLFAGLFGLDGGVTPLSAADAAKLLPGLLEAAPTAPASGRRRRRRRALARSGHAAAGSHEARRSPAAAAAADGGDGAAGLRPMRLQLQGLCGRAVRANPRSG